VTIHSLNQQGGILSEPKLWDGNLADDFRGNVWLACSRALAHAHTQLQELQRRLQTITPSSCKQAAMRRLDRF
jgi:hypothetical protein